MRKVIKPKEKDYRRNSFGFYVVKTEVVDYKDGRKEAVKLKKKV